MALAAASPYRRPMTEKITNEQLAAMSGLEIMQGAARGALPLAAMGELMGFRIVAVERGRVTFEGETGPRLLNPLGIVHGGFALTLIDSAAGCALHSDLEPGTSYATVETKVNFVRPIAADLGTVTCEGRLIS